MDSVNRFFSLETANTPFSLSVLIPFLTKQSKIYSLYLLDFLHFNCKNFAYCIKNVILNERIRHLLSSYSSTISMVFKKLTFKFPRTYEIIKKHETNYFGRKAVNVEVSLSSKLFILSIKIHFRA